MLLIGYFWVRDRRRPAAAVLVGAVVCLVGLVFVLDLRDGLTLNPVGVAWGLGAAVCLAVYFLLSEDAGDDPVHPLLLTTVGTGVGGLVILAVAATGFLPLTARAGTTALAGTPVAWWVPVGLLITVSAVFAYLTGIVGVRRLGSSVASFVALSEVIFAAGFAVVLLAQRPSAGQLVGGVLVLIGIAVVQRASSRASRIARPRADERASRQRFPVGERATGLESSPSMMRSARPTPPQSASANPSRSESARRFRSASANRLRLELFGRRGLFGRRLGRFGRRRLFGR